MFCKQIIGHCKIKTKKLLFKRNHSTNHQKSNFVILNSSEKDQVPIKAWIKGVEIEHEAKQQLLNMAKLPVVFSHISVMPDVHLGKGATVGSVIPTIGAIIPAAVGVDIGCGMNAVQTSLKAEDLPDNLKKIRLAIESAIPHGRTLKVDKGSFQKIPEENAKIWKNELQETFKLIKQKHPDVGDPNTVNHLGTLGTGNHFIELCLDENKNVWFMLHSGFDFKIFSSSSGSRGVGNRIGTYFIDLAKKDMKVHMLNVPDKDLSYFKEGTKYFDDYVEAVSWAQKFAKLNRQLMMQRLIEAVRTSLKREFSLGQVAVNCHHNYVQKEIHFGKQVFVTRKGAVRAGKGEFGIIPGSMGVQSYIVRGLGNPESFESCSHGAGRKHSRTAAKKLFSIKDHIQATEGVECRKDESVIDETPAAYKNIESVMEAQSDLVEVVHTLKQIVCVKG